MSIYGDQWLCICGWHNVFLRKNCRNCNVPRPLGTLETESAVEMMNRLCPPQSSGTPDDGAEQ